LQLFLYSQWHLPHLGYGSAIYALEALIILVGLWLLSRIARYVGAALYFLSGGAVAFALWGIAKPMHVSLVWAVTMAVLSLVAASILIFSKSFAREFAAEREKRPVYKKILLNAFTVVIVFAVAAAALVDVVHFAPS
jgi:hypothetical protein